MMHDLANDDGFVALKRAAEDREGWRYRDVRRLLTIMIISRGTGIRGLMRGKANLPQGNQELLVVRNKVGRPQVSLG